MVRDKIERADVDKKAPRAAGARSWGLTATAKLNKQGRIKSWRVISTALADPIRLNRTEGSCLAILAGAAKKCGRPCVPLREFRDPDRPYGEHRCSNPQRSIKRLSQKLLKVSPNIVEHAGPKGYRLMAGIMARVSTASDARTLFVSTITLNYSPQNSSHLKVGQS